MTPKLAACLRELEVDTAAGKTPNLEEIRQAWRDMVFVWHPDRFLANARIRARAERKIRRLNHAYEHIMAAMTGSGRLAPTAASLSPGTRKNESASCRTPGSGFMPQPRPQNADGMRGKRVIAIASGKGGVGKTNFSVNLSLALAESGMRVTILDADLGMANVDVLCGLTPRTGLAEVIAGKKSLPDVVIRPFPGVQIIPGVSGVAKLSDLTEEQRDSFFAALADYDARDQSDLLLIDIGAGMSKTVRYFMRAASETILVLTPEPTSLTDAYALIKTVTADGGIIPMRVVVNKTASEAEARRTVDSLTRITRRFLGFDPPYLGYIRRDEAVLRAVRRQSPWVISHPGSRASMCVRRIARRLTENAAQAETEAAGGVRGFFKRMSGLLAGRPSRPSP
ncbi:ATP-binding protein [bacterium DOLZORAL124_64_63]|nr:MAG: ATP-binding protein [bacterium DOLZORAL124_64_63]